MAIKYIKIIYLLLLTSLLLAACQHTTSIAEQKKAATEKLYIVSNHSNSQGNFALSHHLLDSVFFKINKPTDWEKISYYSATCWMNRSLGNYELCLKKGDSCLAALNLIGLNNETVIYYANIYLEKGMAYIKLSNFNEANKLFFEAKKVIDQINDTCSKQELIDYLGLVLYQQHEYDLAKNAFMEELECLNKCFLDNKYLQYGKRENVLGNLGLCLYNLNKFDSAKIYYNKALKLCEAEKLNSIGDSMVIQNAFNGKVGVHMGNLAKVYIPSNLDSAALLYEKAVQFNKANSSEIPDGQLCMYQLADVYLQQKKFDKAFATLQGLRLSLDTLKNINATLGYRKVLYNYYSQTQQHQKALAAYQNYVSLKDSLQSKELGFTTTNINKELRDREQQLQIQLLNKDKNIGKLYLLIIAAALLLAAIIAFMVYRNYYKSKKKNLQLTLLNEQITNQQKLTEEALQQLAISNKAKDKILNVVAHDLRNPIGAIANFLKVVQMRYEHGEAEDKILKSTERAATHSLGLINELLEVNRINEGKLALNKTNVELIELLNSIVEQLQYRLNEKHQKVVLNKYADSILIIADSEKLQRVITNLIDNAIKFSANNKTIQIIADKADKEIMLQIKDEGIGIPEDIIEQLFTASITIKRSGTNNEKSNGLGLSICKQIIEAHSGTIDVQSEENIGTTFIIKLPIKFS